MVTVTDQEAYKMTKRLAHEEGLLLGISSGANVAAALKVGAKLGPDARVVTICCDKGDRYFSLEDEFEAEIHSESL